MLTQDHFIKKQIKRELAGLGIDISKDEYFKNSKFKELEKEYVFEGIFIPKSWWIEKNLVGQDRLKKIYGIYAMGIEHDFSESELKNSVWMWELADKYSMAKVTTADEFIRTEKNIEQYFFRKEEKGSGELGLVERLKRAGLDIEKFNSPNAKKEKVKLLYFLFCFEYEKKIKIGPFLKNPTLENVDNLCAGDKTRNGELMAFLKNNLQKEISLDYVRKLKEGLDNIITEWEEQICYIRYLVSGSNNMNLFKDINDDLKWLLFKIEQAPVLYFDTLLETFYLKLSLHEVIGREKDLLDLSEKYSDAAFQVNGYQLEKYEELKTYEPTINYKEISAYIQEHRRLFAQCVFGRESIKSNDYKKLDRAAERLEEYLEFLKSNTKMFLLNELPVLYLVSYFQEFIFIDKNEKIDNRFYRYKTNDKKSLNSEIYSGKEAFRKNQMAWLTKVRRRYMSNCGNGEIDIIARETENLLDDLLMEVYKSNSLREMKYTAWLILSYIRTFAGNRETVLARGNTLVKILKKKEYCISAAEERMFRVFLGSLGGEQYESFVAKMIEEINSAENRKAEAVRTYHYDIISGIYTEGKIEGSLKITIRPLAKEVELRQWEYCCK